MIIHLWVFSKKNPMCFFQLFELKASSVPLGRRLPRNLSSFLLEYSSMGIFYFLIYAILHTYLSHIETYSECFENLCQIWQNYNEKLSLHIMNERLSFTDFSYRVSALSDRPGYAACLLLCVIIAVTAGIAMVCGWLFSSESHQVSQFTLCLFNVKVAKVFHETRDIGYIMT